MGPYSRLVALCAGGGGGELGGQGRSRWIDLRVSRGRACGVRLCAVRLRVVGWRWRGSGVAPSGGIGAVGLRRGCGAVCRGWEGVGRRGRCVVVWEGRHCVCGRQREAGTPRSQSALCLYGKARRMDQNKPPHAREMPHVADQLTNSGPFTGLACPLFEPQVSACNPCNALENRVGRQQICEA